MINLLKADWFRIFKKKSVYVFLVICSALFITLMVISNSQGMQIEGFKMMMTFVSSLIPQLIGIYVFLVIFSDDLRSKTIQSAIGFGKSRTEIVLVKMLEGAIAMLALFVIMFLHAWIVPMILGLNITVDVLKLNAIVLGLACLKTFAYFALASIITFAVQKSSGAILAYVLLCTGTVNLVASLIFSQQIIVNIFGNVNHYFLSNQFDTLQMNLMIGNGISFQSIFIILMYVILGIGFASFMFSRRELEF